MRALARHIGASGIRHVTGGVIIDTSRFPEGAEEAGTRFTALPICVNDNMIDIIIAPGPAVNTPAVRRSQRQCRAFVW